MKIPDVIKCLPAFDGDPKLLEDFIQKVEDIVSLMQASGKPSADVYLAWLAVIRGKIVGPANEVLESQGVPLDWEEIKNKLIEHFDSKSSRRSLIRKLSEFRQTSTIEEFYGRVIDLLQTLINDVVIHEADEGVRNAKRELYRKYCLNVFVSKLKEPIRSAVRAREPNCLHLAFEYSIAEQILQNQNSGVPTPRDAIPNIRKRMHPMPLNEENKKRKTLSEQCFQSTSEPMDVDDDQSSSSE